MTAFSAAVTTITSMAVKAMTTWRGDDGDDYIEGGAGADALYGGQGTDVISGGGGRDLIFGGVT